MVDNVVFYKGAFPARYGGQLSSVVDIGIREGDMQQYHGEINLGMLSSKIHLEGPIWKNRTSFNLAARASYFDWIVQPLLKEVSNKKSTMTPYADLNYYDLTAKLTHRFNEKHKLSAFFYYGKDVNNQAPAGSGIKNSYVNQDYEVNPEPQDLNVQESKLSSGTENDWSNVASTLYWSYRPTERLAIHTNLNYSQYKYRLKQFNYRYSKKTVEKTDGTTELKYLQENSSSSESLSGIQEFSASTLFQYHSGEQHSWRWGGKLSQQYFNPRVRLHQSSFYQTQTSLSESRLDTLVNNSKDRLTTAALFVEDNWILNKHWKANIGLRYALFHVPHKTYHSLEPRLSLRWLFRKDMALKISYAHMAQGVHLLSNSNLVMPSDVWVSITEQVPLMKSDQYAIGYNYEIGNNIELSVEGYYKRMKNLLEYQEGSSYLSNGEKGWQNMVSLGEGEAYGVELYAEKKSGRTTGWVSYTWSKSLRLFNRPGEELNGGRTFYSGSDRRHNFSAVVVHKLNKHWDVSAAWTYQSGKRGTLPITTFMSGIEYDFDAYWEGSYNNVSSV
ncbi:MAG: TonB-dependent receptor [Bacteroides sp.]|nr:TonB-dependent receptor [Bacteroides sp.]